MKFAHTLGIAIAFVFFVGQLAAESPTNSKPNIVVILADDLGYGDVSPLNAESKIPTPNFARLAAEGMTFTDAHSPSAVCTPTRYSLLTGRYSWRTSLKRGVLGGYSHPLIKKDRQTIASVLKAAGYRTGCVGKWHLGLGWQWKNAAPRDINNMGIAGGKPQSVDYSKPLVHSPLTVGFDTSFIIPASLDMSPYVYIRNNQVTAIPDKVIPGKRFPAFYRKGEIASDFKIDESLDRLTDEACGFIRKNSKGDKPFFLYFPLSAPHKPVLPHKRFRGKTKLGTYGDFITQVDWTVGQVLETLDDTKTADNTVVIVTSDNGSFMYAYPGRDPDHVGLETVHGFNPKNHRANGPWRGTKADIWEAGHRVPFFVRWPKGVAAKSKSSKTICHVDILATVAEIAGTKFDRKSAEDSFSFVDALKQQKTSRPPVLHQSGSGFLAIRDGDWKLVLGSGSGGRQKPRGKRFGKPYHLYNLAQDPGETKNLIDSHGEVAKELEAKFRKLAHGDEVMAPKKPKKKK